MTDADRIRRELETLWYEHIPLTRALDVEMRAYDGDTLTLAADLAPNVNVHGTAFAGSLYAVTALCAWSLVYLQLDRRGLDGAIVLAEGRIRYLAPVADTLVARCRFGDQTAALRTLATDGRTRFPLFASVDGDDGIAAEFEGDFAVRLGAGRSVANG